MSESLLQTEEIPLKRQREILHIGKVTSVNASHDLMASVNTSVKIAKWFSSQDR